MIGFDETYNPCEWGSHLPCLLACLAATDGPVLEVGVGHFSTPALHAFCAASHRHLVSVDDHVEWVEEFRNRYMNAGHQFIAGDYDKVIPTLAMDRWSVVLLDNSPGGPRRATDLNLLLPYSEFVVVHDYHRENVEHIQPIINGYYFHVSKTYQPPTLVVSKLRSMPEGLIE